MNVCLWVAHTGYRYHDMLMVTLRLETDDPVIPSIMHDYGRANYSKMKKEMKSEDWLFLDEAG